MERILTLFSLHGYDQIRKKDRGGSLIYIKRSL